MRKPKVPVVTSTSRPPTLSNFPSTRPGPGTRLTYSRFAEMEAPGGGSAPNAVAGSSSASASTPTSSIRLISPKPPRVTTRELPGERANYSVCQRVPSESPTLRRRVATTGPLPPKTRNVIAARTAARRARGGSHQSLHDRQAGAAKPVEVRGDLVPGSNTDLHDAAGDDPVAGLQPSADRAQKPRDGRDVLGESS